LDDSDQTAAGQIRTLVGRLDAGERMPLFVFDGGYDSAQLTLDLADVPAAVLVRLRSDRCLDADPPPRPPGSTGRPRRHGAKYEDSYRLCYVRGPEGIIVALAEQLS
jgi:hypothetical protein